MYEHRRQPLASKSKYRKRIAKNASYAFGSLTILLSAGTLLFHHLHAPGKYITWIDAFHNASMILSGMGPVLIDELSFAGKIFSSSTQLSAAFFLLLS